MIAIRNPHLQLYADAARQLGIDVRVIDPRFVIVCSKQGRSWPIYRANVPINDSAAFQTSLLKNVTNRLLRSAGLDVPEVHEFADVQSAQAFFQVRRYDVVVKPNRGFGGCGVTVCPQTDDEFFGAFAHASGVDSLVLVEQFVAGRHYRVLVLDEQVIAVAERLPASIVGDGTQSIGELIAETNGARAQSGRSSAIVIDLELHQYLRAQQLRLSDVPRPGTRIELRRNANLTTGGVTIDRTDEIHPDLAAIAVVATRSVGLHLAGVDLIAADIAAPESRQIVAVNEVNGNPGLRIHHFPSDGKARNVAAIIQQYIFDRRTAA
jgi:cyanophycin synthetase